MRISPIAVSALIMLVASSTTSAFVTPSFLRLHSSSSLLKSSNNPITEFDYLLGEGNGYDQNAIITTQRRVINTLADGKKIIVQKAGSSDASTVQQVSSEATVEQQFPGPQLKGTGFQEQQEEYDPYTDSSLDPVAQKIQVQQEKRSIGNFVSGLSFQELMYVLVIPTIATFAAARWGINKALVKFEKNADEILDSYASEMIYHDGDFDEMKLAHNDYKRRLVWLGPKKKEYMLKRFLEAYAKKKVVSPQSISSLSYIFTMYNLSEEKAAEILVSLCKKMGNERISSAGKLLFFGSHILKSKEGKAAMRPVKEMIMATYRDQTNAEKYVDAAQDAMGEAAYRNTVQSLGKDQKTLTVGWQVLGLDKETATRIFEEEAKEGFVSDREAMYGGQAQKYDKKGNAINEDGSLVDPEAAKDDDEEDDDVDGGSPTGSVFECGECGYTLFIAKGRDFKFYGDDFECPECGAKKEKFVSRDIEED